MNLVKRLTEEWESYQYDLPSIENLKKWVEALRSGEYKQTTGALYQKEEDSYCCIGVYDTVICNQDHSGKDTDALAVALLLGAENGSVDQHFFEHFGEHFAHFNDNTGCSFTDIADAVEEVFLS